MNLKQNYEKACNGYAEAFCKKYDLGDYHWIDLGYYLEASDYVIKFWDVMYMVDNDIPFKDFSDWYDYIERINPINADLTKINLRSWCRGCPRLSDEELSDLEELNKK